MQSACFTKDSRSRMWSMHAVKYETCCALGLYRHARCSSFFCAGCFQ
jgi:hypothetical protein